MLHFHHNVRYICCVRSQVETCVFTWLFGVQERRSIITCMFAFINHFFFCYIIIRFLMKTLVMMNPLTPIFDPFKRLYYLPQIVHTKNYSLCSLLVGRKVFLHFIFFKCCGVYLGYVVIIMLRRQLQMHVNYSEHHKV